MPTGDCFRCHQPGHWANKCPLKTTTKPTTAAADAVASPPLIDCPCNGGACYALTSKTEKNPNRRFFKCPSIPSCGFFKWCDQVNIIKSESISVNPTCPCGSGPCRRVTVIVGPNAQRSYFVCSKSFGACGFFQWENDVQIQPESEEVGNESTLGNRVVDRIAQPVKETLPVNAVTLGKESIPAFAGFDNCKPVSNGIFASADGIVPSFDLITVDEDAVGLETEEQVLPSVSPKHLEPQVETLCNDLLEFNGTASFASEGITGVSQNTSDSVSNGKTKPDHNHQPEPQSTISGETGASFSGNSSLMDLIEQYNSEMLHFKSVSVKYVDALTAFTGSYKQLESLRDRAPSLRKQLREVEKQVKLCEAETSEFAMSLQEVSGEMAKLQKKMVETAGKVAKEVRVNKQRDFAAPYIRKRS